MSSIELERVCAEADAAVAETAAVGVPPPQGGPERLTVFAVLRDNAAAGDASPERLRSAMGQALRRRLNPLFKVEAVRVVAALPRTGCRCCRRERGRGGCAGAATGTPERGPLHVSLGHASSI